MFQAKQSEAPPVTSTQPEPDPSAPAPLAARMRPRSLAEFAGQRHILAEGKLLRRAIEADPADAAAYEALGRLQLRAKRFDDAVTTFERLVEAVPTHPKGHYRLAFALRKAGRYPEA